MYDKIVYCESCVFIFFLLRGRKVQFLFSFSYDDGYNCLFFKIVYVYVFNIFFQIVIIDVNNMCVYDWGFCFYLFMVI